MTTRASELLIELDRASREPLRRQLESGLRAAIEDGSLPDGELDYPADSWGAVDLRAALAGYLSRVRGVRVDRDNLILTLGFLHGLDLLFRGLVLRGALARALSGR
ncbi:MAG TPA: hypothetical protein VFD04_14415 [Actinomycetes bacterium]|jgi:aspartate/methionine/tyrosine aminotransferase|nr:hypothetical protein [Actinomycetes bacterium]